jgi:hypothetical protein
VRVYATYVTLTRQVTITNEDLRKLVLDKSSLMDLKVRQDNKGQAMKMTKKDTMKKHNIQLDQKHGQPERLNEKTYYRNKDGTYPHLEAVIRCDSLNSTNKERSRE